MPRSSSGPSYEAWLEAVLESVSEAFFALDPEWRIVVFNRAAENYFGVSRKRMLGRGLLEVYPPASGTPIVATMRRVMDEGTATTVETASITRPDRTIEVKVTPMRGGGLAVTLADITERKDADERQRLLVNELNHRVKNALATVQAIAAQSLRGGDVPPAARERFLSRLMALSEANDVLVAENWAGAGLMALAVRVASPHGAGERFEIAGPAVHMRPSAATAMALALHELATNAAKYGALSRPGGRVRLTWSLEGEGPGRRLTLAWRESGGPKVTPPTKVGFGTRLIERGLTGGLKAQVKLDYAPEGLVFTMSAPLGQALSED